MDGPITSLTLFTDHSQPPSLPPCLGMHWKPRKSEFFNPTFLELLVVFITAHLIDTSNCSERSDSVVGDYHLLVGSAVEEAVVYRWG